MCGKEINGQPRIASQVSESRAQSLHDVWTAAWIHPPFQIMPYLLPTGSVGRTPPRRDQI
ncbi:MAG: hypothetical protein A2Z03_05955 [Chloroflexi bacterium RBG_16_56_8]|nr:MAG: hypothetical protein A2Z03_05955 [Chloroflexi bacterium RBG_16_56_8]